MRNKDIKQLMGNWKRMLKNAESLEKIVFSINLDEPHTKFTCKFLSHQLIELSLKAVYFFNNNICETNEKKDDYYKHKFIKVKGLCEVYLEKMINTLLEDEDIKSLEKNFYFTERYGVEVDYGYFGKKVKKPKAIEIAKVNLNRVRAKASLIYLLCRLGISTNYIDESYGIGIMNDKISGNSDFIKINGQNICLTDIFSAIKNYKVNRAKFNEIYNYKQNNLLFSNYNTIGVNEDLLTDQLEKLVLPGYTVWNKIHEDYKEEFISELDDLNKDFQLFLCEVINKNFNELKSNLIDKDKMQNGSKYDNLKNIQEDIQYFLWEESQKDYSRFYRYDNYKIISISILYKISPIVVIYELKKKRINYIKDEVNEYLRKSAEQCEKYKTIERDISEMVNRYRKSIIKKDTYINLTTLEDISQFKDKFNIEEIKKHMLEKLKKYEVIQNYAGEKVRIDELKSKLYNTNDDNEVINTILENESINDIDKAFDLENEWMSIICSY